MTLTVVACFLTFFMTFCRKLTLQGKFTPFSVFDLVDQDRRKQPFLTKLYQSHGTSTGVFNSRRHSNQI